MGKSSNARIAREETTDEAPDDGHWGRVAELIGDQVTGLDRHVKDKYCKVGRFLCLGQFADNNVTWCESCLDQYGGCWSKSRPCKGKRCQYDIDTGDNYYAKDDA